MSSPKKDRHQAGKKRKASSSIPRDQRDIVGSYPKELTAMFEPLYCVLCSSQSNSTTSAMMHYSSKTHKRKVNTYLEEWSERTGEPAPKKLHIDNAKNLVQLRCKDCDLNLTSKQHAQQHQMGRSHQLVIQGKKAPSGSGYYQDGKWIRSQPAANDPSGRFGIGSAFRLQPGPSVASSEADANIPNTSYDDSTNTVSDALDRNNLTSPNTTNTTNTNPDIIVESSSERIGTTSSRIGLKSQSHSSIIADSTESVEEQGIPTKGEEDALFCSLCKCHVTSGDQMSMHLGGSRHRKKAKKFGMVQHDNLIQNRSVEAPADNILASVISGSASLKNSPMKLSSALRGGARGGDVYDISIYRTPSGSYYCRPCDITLPTDTQFRQHLGSRRHSQKNSVKC